MSSAPARSATPQTTFRDVARRTIPAIRWGIDSFFAGNPQANSFDAACYLVGSIARTAAALGLLAVQNPAHYLDAALRALRLAKLEPGEITRIVVHHNIDLLQSGIDAANMSSAQLAQQHAELDLTYHSLQQHLRQAAAPDRRRTAPLPNLQATFALEAEAQVSAMTAILETLETGPQRHPGLAALRRRAHTLLGAAAMVGRPDVVRILQHMETLIAAPAEGSADFDAWPLDLLFQTIDGLAVLVRRPQADDVAMQISETILALYDAPLDHPATALPAGIGQPRRTAANPAAADLSAQEAELHLSPAQVAALLARLDDLAAPARSAAESIAAAAAHAGQTAETAVLRQHLAAAAAALQRQDGVRLALARQLMTLQLLPFERLTNRLRRFVSNTARDQGKAVAFSISGAQLAVDAPTLQALITPLQQLLRQAIRVSIEDAVTRRQAGKPATARLAVTVRQQAGKLVVDLEDDGRQRGAPPNLDLDLESAQRTLAQQGGTIAIRPGPGPGPRFSLSLPAALIAAPLRRLHVGQDVYAVPWSAGMETGRPLPGMLIHSGNRATLNYNGTPIPAFELAVLLGLEGNLPTLPQSYLILSDGQTTRALLVDDVDLVAPLPIQPPGPFLGRLPLVVGMVLPAEGGVLPVLDPTQLLQTSPPTALPAPPDAVRSGPLRVLVADASLSVRQISAAMLRQAGWEPLLARDGREAQALVAQHGSRIDVALIDVNLPDTDGFALAQSLRHHRGGESLPIIFSAAHESAAQRALVASFDRSALLIKPYQDQALLALVQRITPLPSAGKREKLGVTAHLPPA